MRAIALLSSLTLLGCFPHDHHARTVAKYIEGGALVAGIGLEAAINTGADCDAMSMPGLDASKAACHNRAAILNGVGVALILGGMLGFVATVSTEDEAPPPPPPLAAARTADKPAVKLPPGVRPGAGGASPGSPATVR